MIHLSPPQKVTLRSPKGTPRDPKGGGGEGGGVEERGEAGEGVPKGN